MKKSDTRQWIMCVCVCLSVCVDSLMNYTKREMGGKGVREEARERERRERECYNWFIVTVQRGNVMGLP